MVDQNIMGCFFSSLMRDKKSTKYHCIALCREQQPEVTLSVFNSNNEMSK
jgi:hypothetical protein